MSAASTARPARVLGDVGGTNARFALQDGDGAPLREIATLPTADYPSLGAALAHYLQQLGGATPPW
jgi:glucokinase